MLGGKQLMVRIELAITVLQTVPLTSWVHERFEIHHLPALCETHGQVQSSQKHFSRILQNFTILPLLFQLYMELNFDF